MADFSHTPEVNIRNKIGELTPAKFINLILTELGKDTKIVVQNKTKEHLKSDKPNSDLSVSDSYLKEIELLKKELQPNVSVMDMLYNGQLLIADTFRKWPNYGQFPQKHLYMKDTFIAGICYNGHFF